MTGETIYPSRDDVRRRILAAVCELYRHDLELMAADANERSITHNLAEYLQREFPCWHVDCEYNRHGDDVKRLNLDPWHSRPDDLEAKTVFPDIVVHRRRTDQNLVVLEIKKSTGREDTKDIKKLEGFTAAPEYKYKYGVFLILTCDRDSKLQLYQSGELVADWTPDLRTALRELGYGG